MPGFQDCDNGRSNVRDQQQTKEQCLFQSSGIARLQPRIAVAVSYSAKHEHQKRDGLGRKSVPLQAKKRPAAQAVELDGIRHQTVLVGSPKLSAHSNNPFGVL
jgi:hypothetical protein